MNSGMPVVVDVLVAARVLVVLGRVVDAVVTRLNDVVRLCVLVPCVTSTHGVAVFTVGFGVCAVRAVVVVVRFTSRVACVSPPKHATQPPGHCWFDA